ncbi:MAG: RNA polymerase factor sigma-54 [Butyricicoccus sp.]|nr:RNA polymerase factor sigma-54 [Butyricicoccus sp.]
MDLELSQKQGLTLAMQTSMHLLQLNNLQLRSYLGELMTSNAVVELEYPEIEYRPSPFDQQTASKHSGSEPVSKEQLMEDKAELSSVLHDLFLQRAAMKLPEPYPRILRYLIESLDENGFLTETPQESARALRVSPRDVEKCIERLQSMDPAGVGAADLRDCLRLQLLRTAPQDKTALQIVAQHLESMAGQQYSAIARALAVPKAQVIQSCERIRALNPKPLNGLGGEIFTQYIIPDFYVVEDGGQLRCIFNDYYLPKIKIDPSYHELIRSKALSPTDSEYLQKNYREANEIVKFLSYRKTTLQRVVEYILHAQEDFFRNGPGHRAAMANREIAEALSLHESTVSRAVNGKFFECKWGVFPLKSLFVHSVKSESDNGAGLDQVLQRLRQLIAAETPGAAYSDQQLTALLAEEEIHLARRTVAKYRQMLGIPPTTQRNAKHRN